MRRIPLLLSALLLLVTGLASAADNEQAARDLLSKAVDYYRVQGDAAFAAYSRQGEFIDGEHYVFVVDTQGTMLASGGTSAVLIGRNVGDALEPELRQAFKEALADDSEAVRTAEYRWKNVRDGRVELKRVFFQRVGERIIAVGLYLPHATQQQAQALLKHAADELGKDEKATIEAINALSPTFREDDLYAFVVDLDSGRFVAHGYNLRLIGVPFANLRDPEGKPVGEPILALMKNRTEGGYDYRWKNPVTSKIENKHALLRKVGHLLVAVGYYQ